MSDIRIHTCNEEDRERWDQFVISHAECTNYHRWSWKHVFQEVFGWPAIYLLAEEGGTVRGILPLISAEMPVAQLFIVNASPERRRHCCGRTRDRKAAPRVRYRGRASNQAQLILSFATLNSTTCHWYCGRTKWVQS